MMKHRTTWICALLATVIGCSEESELVQPDLAGSLPPAMSDTTLVARASEDPTIVCKNGELGALDVDIARVAGDVEALKQHSEIAETATVQVWLRNPAENLLIEFNGQNIVGEVSERQGAWVLADFSVPIGLVNFAEQPGADEASTPAKNRIAVRSGTSDGGNFACSDYAGAALIAAPVPLPVLMFHKLHPFGDFTDWAAIWQAQLPLHGVPYRNPVHVPSNPAPVQALQIGSEVAAAKAQFGVQRVSLVGHSLSGLSIRHYANFANDVANVMTLGTPHGGSRLFDLLAISMIFRIKLPALAPFYGLSPAPSFWTVFNMTTWYMRFYNWIFGPNPTVNYETVGSTYTWANPCPPPNVDPTCPLHAVWNAIVGTGDLAVNVWSAHALPWPHTQHHYASAWPDPQAAHLHQNNSQIAFNSLIGTIQTTFFSVMAGLSGDTQHSDEFAAGADPASFPNGSSAQGDTYAYTIANVLDMDPTASDATRMIYIDQFGEVTFLIFHADKSLTVNVVAPNGVVFDKPYATNNPDVDFATGEVAFAGSGYTTAVTVNHAIPGAYRVNLKAGAITDPSGVDIVALIKNPKVDIGVQFGDGKDKDYTGSPGDSFNVFVTATGDPRGNADVELNIVSPSETVYTVALRDDGVAPDAQANDDIYSGAIDDAHTKLIGDYGAVVTFDGWIGTQRVTRQAGSGYTIDNGL